MTPRASSTRAWNRPDPGRGLGSASHTADSLPPARPQRPPVYSQGSPPRCLFCFPAEPSKERSCRKCSRIKVTECAGPRGHACPGLSEFPGARPRGDSSSPHSPRGRARLGQEACAPQVRFGVQAPSCFRPTHSAPREPGVLTGTTVVVEWPGLPVGTRGSQSSGGFGCPSARSVQSSPPISSSTWRPPAQLT